MDSAASSSSSSSASSSSSSHQFRPTAEEFRPTVTGARPKLITNYVSDVGAVHSPVVSRPDTPAPFADKSFHLPTSSSTSSRLSMLTSTSGYASGSGRSSCSLSSPISEVATSANQNHPRDFLPNVGLANQNAEFQAGGGTYQNQDYEGRPKNARDRAAYLLEQERDLIHNMSSNSLEQMRQAYVAAPPSGVGEGAGSGQFDAGGDGGGFVGEMTSKSDEDPMESSGESCVSSGVQSDASGSATSVSGDMTHLCHFVERLQQRGVTASGASVSAAVAAAAASSSSILGNSGAVTSAPNTSSSHQLQQQQQQQQSNENAFQRLLKQIPLHDSQLPPPPVFHPHAAAGAAAKQTPAPSVSQLTSMLRQRIMPPSPLTLHPNSGGAAANSGFADGFNAAAAALASPFSASRYSSSGGGGGGHGVGSAYPFSPSTLSNYATSNAALTRRSMTAPHHGTGALHHHHHHHHGAGSGGGNHFHGTHFATTRGTPSPLHPPPQSPFRYPPPGSPFTANKSSCLDLVPFHNNEVDVNNNSNNGER